MTSTFEIVNGAHYISINTVNNNTKVELYVIETDRQYAGYCTARCGEIDLIKNYIKNRQYSLEYDSYQAKVKIGDPENLMSNIVCFYEYEDSDCAAAHKCLKLLHSRAFANNADFVYVNEN